MSDFREVRIYPLGDQWGLFIDGTETIHDTYMEAVTMSTVAEQKVVRGQTVQLWATMLAGLDDWLATLNAKYFSFGAVNEPTDEDLAELGITQADFRNGVTLLQKIASVVIGDTVVEANHTDVLSRLRTDAE